MIRIAHLGLIVWGLFVLTIPFYVMPSGLPQPGNALIFALVPAALWGWNGRLHVRFTEVIRPLLWFTLWVCLVNYGWAFVLDKWSAQKAYTIFPLYYLFNAAVFTAALILYQRCGEVMLRLTLYIVFAQIVFQVAVSLVFRRDLFRDALFFNNPNQLGYYALLAACFVAIVQRRLGVGVLRASVALTGCAYLALLSGSRSALAGIAILFFLLVFSNPRLIIAASVAAVLLTSLGPVARAIENVESRYSRDGQLGFAEERGYDRLWEYKEYMVIGAGEGDVGRFTDRPYGREIHSSFATILFSYGLLGAALFLVFLVRVVRGAATREALMLVPTLAYAVAHQGLRSTLLWVLFAAFVALKVPSPRRAEAAA